LVIWHDPWWQTGLDIGRRSKLLRALLKQEHPDLSKQQLLPVRFSPEEIKAMLSRQFPLPHQSNIRSQYFDAFKHVLVSPHRTASALFVIFLFCCAGLCCSRSCL
jgi:hypothetical protein